jgi:hypothetical protein
MSSLYKNKSPWHTTAEFSSYLGNINVRPVSAEPDDWVYTIEPQYNYRPDLLAYDLYGSSKLWWVFTQRNMDILKDPIFDFKSGTSIHIPQKNSLFDVLGL